MDYCIARGLTPETIAPMGGELLAIDRAAQFLGAGIYGFKSIGAVAVFVFPLAPERYQGRLLYDPVKSTNIIPMPGVVLKKDKQPKYYNPKNSANFLYIPPHLTDWFSDTKYNLLIVEGALNAVRLAAAGYHAVAITGVHNCRTGGKGTPLIPELIKLVQSEQAERITILFDSDTANQENKRELWNATHNLAQELMKLRAKRRDTIYICRPLPKSNGDKCGPDDFLHERGIDEFNKLLAQHSERYDDNPYLQVERKALDRFVWEQHSGMFWDCDIRHLIHSTHANHIMMTFGVVDDIMAKNPKVVVYDTVRLLAAPNVRIANGVVYQPDDDQVYIQGEDGEYKVNRFDPRDVPQAIKGDVNMFYKMMNSLCRNDPTMVHRIAIAFAQRVQFPATTPKYAILFTGEQGSGKSNMCRLVGKAISRSYSPFRPNLNVDFNSNWVLQPVREWAEFDKKMDEEWLKDLITGDDIEVRTKYGANYKERNFAFNIFTCNGLQSKIQEGDRRFLVGGYGHSDDKRFGLEFERWVNSTGPNHLRYHLLNEVDVSGYDDLDTSSIMKDQVISASKSFRATVKDEILEVFEAIPKLECIPSGLMDHFLEPHRVSTISFMKQFGQFFVKPALERVKITGVTSPVRFRAFKNFQKWEKCTDTDEYRKQYELAIKLVNIDTNKKY
jgi:hypothetical protein